jgi:hypothetical protein
LGQGIIFMMFCVGKGLVMDQHAIQETPPNVQRAFITSEVSSEL